jgi:hypothetical protein
MMRRLTLVVLIVAGVVGCVAAVLAQRPATAVRMTLSPGQVGKVERTSRIRFDRVTADSRCPADAACIQAGEAVAGITVTGNDRRRASYELHTSGATSIVHDDLTISLEALEPRPTSARPIRRADYRLTLRVSR